MLSRRGLIETFHSWRASITEGHTTVGVIGAKDYDSLIEMILEQANVRGEPLRRMGDYSSMSQKVDELMDLINEKRNLKTRLADVETRIFELVGRESIDLGEGVRIIRDDAAASLGLSRDERRQRDTEISRLRNAARLAVNKYIAEHASFTLDEIKASLATHGERRVSAILAQFRKAGDVKVDYDTGVFTVASITIATRAS